MGQAEFYFVLLALMLSEMYFKIRALLHAPEITGRYFHKDPTTFFHAYMQYF